MHRELLDVFLHTDPQQDLQGLHSTQSQSEHAWRILEVPILQIDPELEKELKAYLYRHKDGRSLSAQALAQIRSCARLIILCENGHRLWYW